MGRWSRPLAQDFVRWVDPPPDGHWLDIGTGTGALATAICAMARPASVVACDPSVPFIESAQQRLPDSRVTFVVAEAGSLPRRKGGYDAIVSGLALNFFPDPGLAMEEQLSTVCPGGLVGAFVWDYAYGMEFLRHFWDAAAAIEPKAADMDEARRFPICNPDSLKSLFEAPFLGGTGPAPRLVSTLSSEQREALIDDLKSRLPIQSGGSIELWARAWAVVGHRGQR